MIHIKEQKNENNVQFRIALQVRKTVGSQLKNNWKFVS